MGEQVYLADDEANIRSLMQSFLEDAGFRVRTFADGDALLAAFEQQPADLVILDIMMPGTDGLTLCSQLRRQSSIPIVIVSARDSELDRITGITLGSDDYLVKPFSPIELVARVKAIFRRMALDRSASEAAPVPAGAAAVPAGAAAAGRLTLQPWARQVVCDGQALDLSPTEYTLLAYLLQKKGQAISREELLRHVWQFDFDVDTRATDDMVKRLRRKLAAADSGVQIESVWGFGFRLADGSAQ